MTPMGHAMLDRSSPDVDLHTIAAVIARSQIWIDAGEESRLPAGFDEVDVAILDWIAAQARLTRHTYALM